MADSAGPAASDQSGAPRHGVDSEVGRLRTVMLHRPGPELKRLTPRNNDKLLFDGIPWVGRAQDEHDAFAQALRDHGVEVLYLADLLATALEVEPRPATRPSARCCATRGWARRCTGRSRPTCAGCTRPTWPTTLMAGLAHEEMAPVGGLVYRFMDRHDFVIDPLPNLLFTRDSSVWIRDRVAVTSLAMPARMRETTPDPRDLPAPPALRRHRAGARPGERAGRGRRRAAARSRRGGRRRRRADHAGRRRAAGPHGVRPRPGDTRCSPCRSPRSGPRCTSTPSARWSTSTRS